MLLESALNYAAQGWAIFPLRAREKLPMSAEITYKHATNSAAQIAAWWGQYPDANIGLQPAQSGLIILDIDPKNGGLVALDALEREHGTLTTRHVITGSGGRHYYYRHPGGDIRNHIGIIEGVDVLAATGHVVAPPSIHPNGNSYMWKDEGAGIETIPAWLLALVAPRQQQSPRAPRPAMSLSPGLRGNMSKEATDFLTNGAAPGTWNHRLFKAGKEAQQAGYDMDEFIDMAAQITGSLDSKDMATIGSVYNTPPKYQPRVDPNAALRNLIYKCHIIRNVADPMDTRVANLFTGDSHDIHLNTIRIVVPKDELKDYLTTNTIQARFTYDPKIKQVLSIDTDTLVQVYNMYEPAAWMRRHFYMGEPLPVVSALPEVYETFFKHLTDNDELSYTYLLDWLATSLTGRNFTILTAIGEQGIGKGVLGEIMELLHGKKNFVKVRDQVFKSHFNAPLKNRTLVYVDEADLREKSSQDRIKDTVNETIEIEEKGKDACTLTNHASFYLSSNSYDAVKVERGDRRFSIIQLTNQPLRETLLIHRIEELRAPSNIAALGSYLMHRKVTSDMLSPIVTGRADEVKEASMSDWEEYVIRDWAEANRGKTVPMATVQQSIVDHCNLRGAPGRRKFVELAKRYPDVIQVRQDGAKRSIIVKLEPQQVTISSPGASLFQTYTLS